MYCTISNTIKPDKCMQSSRGNASGYYPIIKVYLLIRLKNLKYMGVIEGDRWFMAKFKIGTLLFDIMATTG